METYKSGLNAELTTISPCTLQLTATVPAEVGKKAYNRHLDYYSKHVQKPGFRAGHVPQSMILSLHGKEILSDTAAYLANQARKSSPRRSSPWPARLTLRATAFRSMFPDRISLSRPPSKSSPSSSFPNTRG